MRPVKMVGSKVKEGAFSLVYWTPLKGSSRGKFVSSSKIL